MHIGRRFGLYGSLTPGLEQLRLGPLWLTWIRRDHQLTCWWRQRLVLFGHFWLSQEENRARAKRQSRER